MSAKKMFEKLGYELIQNDEKKLIYFFKGKIGLYPHEDKRTKPHILYGTDKKIEFYKDAKQFIIYSQMLREDYESDSQRITMDELQAIIQQCKELGCLDE